MEAQPTIACMAKQELGKTKNVPKPELGKIGHISAPGIRPGCLERWESIFWSFRDCAKQELGGQGRSQAELGNEGL
jgi:hypothetical protein